MVINTSIFNHNDGTSANVLKAQGTIPMVYRKVTYNIPITIWLLESYCRKPPLVYVTPARNMVIKRHHPFVDASGLVSSPYLMNWVFPSSNLVDMVKNLSILFGQTPPLFTKIVPQVLPQQGNPIPPHQQHDNNQLKKETINKLVELIHNDMAELKKTSEKEIDRSLSEQSELRLRGDELDKGLGELQEEKDNLQQQLQFIVSSTDVLETWLHDNKTKQPNFEKTKQLDFDIEDAFENSDVLSKQMMENSAADLAIDDVLYSLDEAVRDGAIPVEVYLKNVRRLSREQFFYRATMEKVRAAQVQVRVANMATRAGTYFS